MPRLLSLALATTLALDPASALACDPAPVFDGDPATGVSVSVGRIADVIWVPLEIDGLPVPEGAGPSLQVSPDGKVEGTTGCSRFTGTAEMDAGGDDPGPAGHDRNGLRGPRGDGARGGMAEGVGRGSVVRRVAGRAMADAGRWVGCGVSVVIGSRGEARSTETIHSP
jgi:META domain